MSAREEFILDLRRGSLSHAEVCRRHGISRKTGHKWRTRYDEEGREGLADRTRRPKKSPLRMAEEIERRVVEIRRGI